MLFKKYPYGTTILGIKFTIIKYNEYAKIYNALYVIPKQLHSIIHCQVGESIGSLIENAWSVCNFPFLQGKSPSNQFWTFKSCLRQEF